MFIITTISLASSRVASRRIVTDLAHLPNTKTMYVKCHGRQAWLTGLFRCSHVATHMPHQSVGQTNARKMVKFTVNIAMFNLVAFSDMYAAAPINTRLIVDI